MPLRRNYSKVQPHTEAEGNLMLMLIDDLNPDLSYENCKRLSKLGSVRISKLQGVLLGHLDMSFIDNDPELVELHAAIINPQPTPIQSKLL